MSNIETYLEFVEMMRVEALKPADCPSCGGYWFQDLDECGVPFTCFRCGNDSIRYLTYEVDPWFESQLTDV